MEGRLDGLAMTGEGDRVNRRQPLATMFSRTLLTAANDYKLALDKGGEALDAATRRLEHFGLVAEQIKTIPQRQPEDPHFGILSQFSGTIVKSYVSEGQCVKEGEKMFEVADLSKLWFVFNAYAQDLPLLKIGQVVSVHTPSMPGRTLKARIGFISPNLDVVTHSVRVRVVLENPERLIKNNTSADGLVELDEPEVVAIPRSAVLWPGGTPRVYVEQAEGAYQQRDVKLGRAGDSVWEVLEGLDEGERVVLSGNLLIDGQAQLNTMAGALDTSLSMNRATAGIP